MAVIRVLVVDDADVVHAGMRALVSEVDDITIAGEARSPREAASLVSRLDVDVAIVDDALGGGRGIEAANEILRVEPDARIIMWAATATDDHVFAAIMAGVRGFILRRSRTNEILGSIRAVAAGGSLIDPTLAAGVLDRVRQERSVLGGDRLEALSPREADILSLVAAGRTNREIADAIHLSEKTVKNHLTRILAKLQVARRSEAAAYYARFRAG
jgi:DNA-binding NarL/FixJ family response regulator